MGAPKKENNQVVKAFSVYPSDFEELKRLKIEEDLPWSSFFKLLIEEHKKIKGEKK